eukprot:746558-Hanusia_phi.AAC.5
MGARHYGKLSNLHAVNQTQVSSCSRLSCQSPGLSLVPLAFFHRAIVPWGIRRFCFVEWQKCNRYLGIRLLSCSKDSSTCRLGEDQTMLMGVEQVVGYEGIAFDVNKESAYESETNNVC